MQFCIQMTLKTIQDYKMSNFKSNRITSSIPHNVNYFQFRPGIGWYRYQEIGNRPALVHATAASAIACAICDQHS